MNTHTPGPWIASDTARKVDSSLYRAGVTAENHAVSPCAAFAQNEEQAIVNARLIATAPEMLEALKQMCKEFKDYDLPYGSEAYLQAHLAIAKAEGKE